MAHMVSFVRPANGYRNTADIEAYLVQLGEIVNNKSYLKDYSTALELVIKIHHEITNKIPRNSNHVTLIDMVKMFFQGNLTRPVYALILQELVDTISKKDYVTDFFKYNDIVEDKEDIKIEDTECGTKLKAFNTKIEIVINKDQNVDITSPREEIATLVHKLGISGTYYMFKAIGKVAAIGV